QRRLLSQRRDPPPYRPDPAAGAGPQSGPAPERPAPVQPAGYAAQRGDAAAALVSLLREPAGWQALAWGLVFFSRQGTRTVNVLHGLVLEGRRPPARRTRAGARRPRSAPQPPRRPQQQAPGPGPAPATIGNGNPIPQLAGQRLIAIEQVTLEHYRPQAIIPGQALVDHFMQYRRLTQRVLAAVGVAAVDHDGGTHPGLIQR